MLEKLLKEHIGHQVEIAQYGNVNFALEDLDTNEVIFDTDAYDLVGKDEYTVECKKEINTIFCSDTIEICRYGEDDYSVYFENGDCSVRGNLIDIIHEIADVFWRCNI